MRDIRVLTASVATFAASVGCLQTAVPQLGLSLGWDSGVLGQLGAALAVGYALGCFACGRLGRGAGGKPIVLAGIAATLASMLAMLGARGAPAAIAVQAAFGFANGFVFPSASAWMLGFQADGIARVTILRHYNVAWTSGIASGMYLTGWICDAGQFRVPFALGACLLIVSFGLAAFAGHPTNAQQPQAAGAGRPRGAKLATGPFLAAVAANVLAVASFRLIVVDYPEQNHLLGHPVHWMGLFTAAATAGQLVSFVGGRVYEHALGLRRAYVLMATAFAASMLTFAYAEGLAPLVVASIVLGLTMGPAFQSSITASTSFFATARTGTTFHEMMVGAAQLVTLAAGYASSSLQAGGMGAVDALRVPLVAMAAVAALVCALQLVLVTRASGPHALIAGDAR